MPRPTKGPRLGGSAQHERHMLANLATQLIVHESITTTEARARRLPPTSRSSSRRASAVTFMLAARS